MKKYFYPLLFSLASFFLFSFSVNANIYIHQLDFSYITNDFLTAKNTIETFLINDSSFTDNYYLYYDTSSSTYKVVLFKNTFTSNLTNGNGGNIQLSTSVIASRGTYFYTFASDYSSLDTFTQDWAMTFSSVASHYNLYLYSNFDFFGNTNSIDDTIIFTYNDFTYSYKPKSGERFKPLYELYLEVFPPTPPDSTPLLTQFYTLCLDRLGYLVNVFSSNYVYLSIFCIFILVSISSFVLRRFTK